MEQTPLNIPVLLGTVRRDRVGIRVADYLVAQLTARGHRPTLVDPMERVLPMLDRMFKEYPAGEAPKVMQDLADLYADADGFLICSAEYNQTVPPAMSNLLDHFLEQYFFRPSGIVTYSPSAYGGVRAAVALRTMLAELGMAAIPSQLAFGHVTDLVSEQGDLLDPGFQRRTDRFLTEFEWYARALKAQRAVGVPG